MSSQPSNNILSSFGDRVKRQQPYPSSGYLVEPGDDGSGEDDGDLGIVDYDLEDGDDDDDGYEYVESSGDEPSEGKESMEHQEQVSSDFLVVFS